MTWVPDWSKPVRVLMLTLPAQSSVSMSGVFTLLTSIEAIMLDEIVSQGRFPRALLRNRHAHAVLEMPIYWGSMPRMITNRPSPLSFAMSTPGTRSRASATFLSGNCPMASAATILVRAGALRSSLIAQAVPTALPVMTKASIFTASTAKTASRRTAWPAATTTGSVWVA